MKAAAHRRSPSCSAARAGLDGVAGPFLAPGIRSLARPPRSAPSASGELRPPALDGTPAGGYRCEALLGDGPRFEADPSAGPNAPEARSARRTRLGQQRRSATADPRPMLLADRRPVGVAAAGGLDFEKVGLMTALLPKSAGTRPRRLRSVRTRLSRRAPYARIAAQALGRRRYTTTSTVTVDLARRAASQPPGSGRTRPR
jgi:hypothetical protein